MLTLTLRVAQKYISIHLKKILQLFVMSLSLKSFHMPKEKVWGYAKKERRKKERHMKLSQ
jgi:hypothetical protein